MLLALMVVYVVLKETGTLGTILDGAALRECSAEPRCTAGSASACRLD
jgi:hypothetical protein